MTLGQVLEEGEERLRAAGIPDTALEAALILEEASGIRRAEVLAGPEREISAQEQERFEELLSRREAHEPFALIAGRQEFMGLSFAVRKGVLIPRQDTETLVEETMLLMHDGMRILDLCTGSGCVALSLLHYSNDTTAVATDISEEAIRLAQDNAEALGLKERITFRKTDLWPAEEPGERFDLITANPPYIASDVIETLAAEVREYDPRAALDGGQDGLSFYRRITAEAGRYLFSDGWLVCEIGYDQGDAVCSIFEDAGFRHTEIIRDLGGNDRVVKGCWY